MSISVPNEVLESDIQTRGYFPGQWWNESIEKARRERVSELKDEIPDADAIGVVDTDADGLGCEVVLRDTYENPTVIQANGGANGISLSHAFDIINENLEREIPVIVADLSPDSTYSAFQASIASVDAPVYIYDHHDWKWTAKTSIETVAEDIVVEDDKCAAHILLEHENDNPSDNLREFVEVTEDHDLWVKEDERSDHLSSLSFELSREEYVQSALEFGADMVRESDHLQGIYGESERKSEKRAQIAVENAEWYDINGITVAVTYFECHQSRVGNKLTEQGADLACIIKPTLSFSLRSTEEFERCAELARGLGGGGHPTSAGGGLYHNIETPEYETNPKFNGIEGSSLNKFEYVWYNQGQPAIETMKEYLEENI